MKKLGTYLLCLMMVTLPGCGLLSPEQQTAQLNRIEQQLASGQITAEQAAVERAVVNSQPVSDIDWGDLLTVAGGAVLSSILGVNIVRGSIHNRKGMAPKVT